MPRIASITFRVSPDAFEQAATFEALIMLDGSKGSSLKSLKVAVGFFLRQSILRKARCTMRNPQEKSLVLLFYQVNQKMNEQIEPVNFVYFGS